MDLIPYVAQLQRQLLLTAEAGGEPAREVAERLSAPLESSTRLLLLDALTEAAAEISGGLSPASVEVRLRGRDVDFAVTGLDHGRMPGPPPGAVGTDAASGSATATADDAATEEAVTDDGGTARLSLRLPERLKPRVEHAAEQAGLSVNAWLVRSIGSVLDQPPATSTPRAAPLPVTGQRHSGWAR